MRRIAAFLLLALLPLSALAAGSSAAAPNSGTSGATKPKLYEVQVLVFANHFPSLAAGEQWGQELNPPIPGIQHALLPSHGLPTDSQLGIAAARIAQHSHYTILAARMWIQSAVGLSKTPPVLIKSDKNGQLNGVIRVFRWHFFHIKLDLRYQKSNSSLTGTTPPLVYSLIQSRRMALKNVNYFDNPKFGVLVFIEPYTGNAILYPQNTGSSATTGTAPATP